MKDKKNNEEFYGDGQLHVFYYGKDYPFLESYLVMLPSGEAFRSNGGCLPNDVNYWDENGVVYTTQGEVIDSLTEEHDGVEYVPNEIDLDSIPDGLKTVILTYAKGSPCKADYEEVKEFCK